jgi:hypothetical protein
MTTFSQERNKTTQLHNISFSGKKQENPTTKHLEIHNLHLNNDYV